MSRPSDKLSEKRYTYTDTLTWSDDALYELVDGVPFELHSTSSPAEMSCPLTVHQDILLELATIMKNFLRDKPCKLFISPSAVRLNQATLDDTFLIPDLYVGCDKNKYHDRGYIGAPELVIEILSPSSVQRDKILKFKLYLEAGVPEYWIVEPDHKIINQFILDDGAYKFSIFGIADTITSLSIEGLQIPLSEIFKD
jgi:Uma2 family endonuclease